MTQVSCGKFTSLPTAVMIAVSHDHGAVFDARAGDGHDRCAANGERLRLASLRGGALRDGDAQQRCDRKRLGRVSGQVRRQTTGFDAKRDAFGTPSVGLRRTRTRTLVCRRMRLVGSYRSVKTRAADAAELIDGCQEDKWRFGASALSRNFCVRGSVLLSNRSSGSELWVSNRRRRWATKRMSGRGRWR